MTSYALAHEWFSTFGGSEAVALEIAAALGVDTVHTLWSDVEAPPGVTFAPSSYASLPARPPKWALLPLMPRHWARLPVQADVVVASSHAFAHLAGLRSDAARVAYVHSPVRYVHTPELDERGAAPALAPVRAALARLDVRAAARLTGVVANSREVQGRIARIWRRDAVVVHPPIDVAFFATPAEATLELPDVFVLGASRFIPYKALHLVIETAERLGLPAVLAGDGPELPALQARAAHASVPVHVLVAPTREQLRELYQRAAVFVFPAMEDFGMMPLEAQAAGTPVVGWARGGTLETVVDGVTGALVADRTPAELALAAELAMRIPAQACRAHAEGFGPERFRRELRDAVDGLVR